MDQIPKSFLTKKQKILDDLALPDDEYSDLSPKGSVDLNIRPLIRDINKLPGLVTTSSCAGRISVFLEGEKKQEPEGGSDIGQLSQQTHTESASELEGVEAEHPLKKQQGFASTGGKGGGKWLLVSHDPVEFDDGDRGDTGNSQTAHQLLGLEFGDCEVDASTARHLRFVKFRFEPMILHVMSASLNHSQPVLSAASSAGFRESGLQSLRCISDPSIYPIVAVRSSGLSLESIIGYYSEADRRPRSFVSEKYLRMLLVLANERFDVNKERIERFRGKLLHLSSRSSLSNSSRSEGWEDPEERRQRKRAEGLLKRASLQNKGVQ